MWIRCVLPRRNFFDSYKMFVLYVIFEIFKVKSKLSRISQHFSIWIRNTIYDVLKTRNDIRIESNKTPNLRQAKNVPTYLQFFRSSRFLEIITTNSAAFQEWTRSVYYGFVSRKLRSSEGSGHQVPSRSVCLCAVKDFWRRPFIEVARNNERVIYEFINSPDICMRFFIFIVDCKSETLNFFTHTSFYGEDEGKNSVSHVSRGHLKWGSSVIFFEVVIWRFSGRRSP